MITTKIRWAQPDGLRVITALTLLGLAACSGTGSPSRPASPPGGLMTPAEFQALPARPADIRLAYGEDSSQFGELRVPPGNGPHPVVALIHGGCWKEPYAKLHELGPIGDALKDQGIATWNIEYRRLYQPGSGWPGTYQDVGRAIDHLRSKADEHHLDLGRVVIVGHSAGGHLAMWAAARHRLKPDSPLFVEEPLRVRGVVNLAGTMDMTDNIERMEQECGDTVVTAMMGGTVNDVPERYAQASAISLLPLSVPQVIVWAEHDDFVPRSLAENYARAASLAGDSVRVLVVPGAGHFELASPLSTAWPIVQSAIQSLIRGDLPQ